MSSSNSEMNASTADLPSTENGLFASLLLLADVAIAVGPIQEFHNSNNSETENDNGVPGRGCLFENETFTLTKDYTESENSLASINPLTDSEENERWSSPIVSSDSEDSETPIHFEGHRREFNPTDESSDDETQLSICTGSTCHSNHGPMIDLKVSTQPTSCLLIRGLNKATSQRLLHNYIEYLGVRMTILMKDAEKRSLGFAFAFFDDDKSAMMAKRKLKHFKIDDNEIKVFFSKREKPLNAPTERYLSRFPRYMIPKNTNPILP